MKNSELYIKVISNGFLIELPTGKPTGLAGDIANAGKAMASLFGAGPLIDMMEQGKDAPEGEVFDVVKPDENVKFFATWPEASAYISLHVGG